MAQIVSFVYKVRGEILIIIALTECWSLSLNATTQMMSKTQLPPYQFPLHNMQSWKCYFPIKVIPSVAIHFWPYLTLCLYICYQICTYLPIKGSLLIICSDFFLSFAIISDLFSISYSVFSIKYFPRIYTE